LLPSVSRMKQKAQTTTCLSNLRQIMAATTAYSTDNDGHYPDCWGWVKSNRTKIGGHWVEWAEPDTIPDGSLFSYMGKDEAAYLCPTFKKAALLNPAFSHLTPRVGYAMNEYLYSWSSYKKWQGKSKMFRSQVERPAELGVFADEGTIAIPGLNRAVINNLCLGVGAYNNSGSHVDGIGTFHNTYRTGIQDGVGNVAFGDGHVATVDPHQCKEIFTPHRIKNGTW